MTITDALDRILALDFQTLRRSTEAQMPTHTLLMKEHLRRMLLWKKALKIELWPFENLARYFVEFPQLEREHIMEQLKSVSFPNGSVTATCMAFILWSLIEKREAVQAYQLPNPYEPLIRMYELGGWFSREQNMIDLWNCFGETENLTLAPNQYDTTLPFIDLNALNKRVKP
jgi:hypothetical protein